MGVDITRETRHFDDATNTTSSLRKKEFEEDYGYIFEPDLTKIEIGKGWVKELVDNMPELPDQRAARLIDMMAEAGIVGPWRGSQARRVMMSLEQWEKARAKT